MHGATINIKFSSFFGSISGQDSDNFYWALNFFFNFFIKIPTQCLKLEHGPFINYIFSSLFNAIQSFKAVYYLSCLANNKIRF